MCPKSGYFLQSMHAKMTMTYIHVVHACCIFCSVENYIPAVCSYHLSDLFSDLLDFAAQFLVLGGRLVYWLPVIRDE